MHVVNVGTLKAKLSYYLRTVQKGEVVRIFDRNREIAILSGISVPQSVEFAAQLVETGLADWQGGKPVVKALDAKKGPAGLADAVLQDRA